MQNGIILLINCLLSLFLTVNADAQALIARALEEIAEASQVVLGDEQADVYLPLLEGKRVALFSNHTGIAGDVILTEASEVPEEIAPDLPFGENELGESVEYGPHILDVLLEQDVDVTLVFSPEHGFQGMEDAGAAVSDSISENTGLPILSLYGKGMDEVEAQSIDLFDVLVVDIQDVGLRYYTYYISMLDLMNMCADNGKEVVILDRPNPNGFYVDGPVLRDEFRSGVGALPIPVVHGMTLGELAQMINGEGWLAAGKDACALTVVPCRNYTHQTRTALIRRPSPNLRTMRAVYLYSSTCFFENTAASVGRGTDHPFEIYGSPYLEGTTEDLYSFTPRSMDGASNPPFKNETCYGRDLRSVPLEDILSEGITLEYLVSAYQTMYETHPEINFFGRPNSSGQYWIDLLIGTDRVREMIVEGYTAAEIEASWEEEVEEFRRLRSPYLLYEE